MTKAATEAQNQDPIQQLEKDLLDDVPGALADLYRESGGFSVAVILLPELSKPTEAHITISVAKDTTGETREWGPLDTFTVPVTEGDDGMKKVMEAFHHPQVYSDKLAIYLGGKATKGK